MNLKTDLPYSFEELSIVLQGPTELGGRPTAALAARTARQAFPGAEVIVSCWVGDRTDSICSQADQLVVSCDPGPQRYSNGVLNVNRQIVSSRAGLEVATRPYVLKARSDIVFRNARLWVEYHLHRWRFRQSRGRDPILITNLTTVNPRRQERYFALCDWIYLGPLDAMTELLSTPPYPDEYLTYPVREKSLLRYNAEQWIAVNYLARHGLDLDLLPDGYVTGSEIASTFHELVGQHFALSSWFRLGLGTQKHRISSFSLDKMYTHREWAEDFYGYHSLFDPERLAVSVAYHPLVRASAKQLKRIRFV